MNTPYVEQDCTFDFAGRAFTSGGAEVTDEYAIVYCSSDMKTVTTWHGEVVGQIVYKTSWALRNGVMSDRMYQIRVMINGRCYTGRTCGASMIARLRAVKQQEI